MTLLASVDAHVYNFNLLTPVSTGDLNRTAPDGKPQFGVNHYGFANTPFGIRIVKYIQNRTTAVVQGALMSGVGDTGGITAFTCSATAGSSAKKIVTTGLTANVHKGAMLRCLDKASSAGAAPEAETVIVKANSAVLVEVDDDMEFSTAILVNDTFNLRSTYNSEAAAAGDNNLVVQGVVQAKDGIAADYYGFVSCYGNTPNTLVKAATALAAQEPIIADAGRVGPGVGTASAGILHIGFSEFVLTSDVVADKSLINMTLHFGLNTTTIDASA
jgi:hypothetical protein